MKSMKEKEKWVGYKQTTLMRAIPPVRLFSAGLEGLFKSGTPTVWRHESLMVRSLYPTPFTLPGGGATRFGGTLNKPGKVKINGADAWMSGGGTKFEKDVSLTTGTNSVNVVATDLAGVSRTNSYSVVVPTSATRSFSYDSNGNQTSDGTRTYTYDAANRLVGIGHADGSSTEIQYDALSRWVGIVEKDASSAVTSTKKFVWDGLRIAEERSGSGNVTRKFFAGGVVQGSTAYAYTKDHLGSIREMIDGSGNIAARYDYDPYGRTTKVSGSAESDMLYTGHYFHAKSGMYFAPYRAYDPVTARWLNRDPFGSPSSQFDAEMSGSGAAAFYEEGIFDPELLPEGPNLFGYVANNPITNEDATGMFGFVIPIIYTAPSWVPWVLGGGITGILGGIALDDYIRNNQGGKKEPEVIPKGKGGYRAEPSSCPPPDNKRPRRNADREGHKKKKNSDRHSASQGHGGSHPPGFRR